MIPALLALTLATPAPAVLVKHATARHHCTFERWTREAGTQVVAEVPFGCSSPAAWVHEAGGDQVLVFDKKRLQRFAVGPAGRLAAPETAPALTVAGTVVGVGVGPSSRPRMVLCVEPKSGPHQLQLFELDGQQWRNVAKAESYGPEGEGCGEVLPKGWSLRGDVTLPAADWLEQLPEGARVVPEKGAPTAIAVGALGELSLSTRPAVKEVIDACGTPCTSMECAGCGLSYRTLGPSAALLGCQYCMDCDPGGCRFLKFAFVPGKAAPFTVDGSRVSIRGDLLLTDALVMTTGGKVLARWPGSAHVRFWDGP